MIVYNMEGKYEHVCSGVTPITKIFVKRTILLLQSIEVPELEHRKSHIHIFDSAHPLLVVALGCLKDKEGERPSADQLCLCLATLKETNQHQERNTSKAYSLSSNRLSKAVRSL